MPRSSRNPSQVEQQVALAFADAQRTYAAHPHSTKLLLSAFSAAPKPFLSAFTHALNRVLLIFSREPAVERLVSFISHFAADQASSTGNFSSLILSYLVAQSNVASKAVRFRTTHLMAATLTALPEDAEIEDQVWQSLQDAVIQRAFDRVPRIRAAAAAALCRLQTSGSIEEDNLDPVTKLLTEMFTKDNSSAVRKAALQAVALTDSTLTHVAMRTRDINPEVRKIAYEILATKLNPNSLHIDERVELLRNGLSDRSKIVTEACREKLLLSGWFDGACEGNIFDFVELLGSNENEKYVLRALNVIFESSRHQQLVDAIEIDVNNLTHADILIMRSMSDTKRLENCIEKFIPSTSAYAEVLRYYAVDDFASKHLLELCSSVDMSDEVGRKNLEDIIRSDFLSNRNVSEDTVMAAIYTLMKAMADEQETNRLLLEILQNDILQGSIEHGDLPSSDDEIYADSSTPQRTDEGYRDWSEVRALNICHKLLQMSRQTQSSSSASNTLHLNLLDVAVLPHLISEDAKKRQRALECLGLYCLLDRSGSEAKTNIPFFIQACKNDIPEIQELALKVIVDFLMIFDFSDTENSDRIEDLHDSSTSHTDNEIEKRAAQNQNDKQGFQEMIEESLSIVSENLTHSDGQVRTVAVQGLARLFFVRRIAVNPVLLSRLLIVHHNPSTEDDNFLRQCLSIFFPAFAMMSPNNRLGLEDTFVPTCRLLMSAPSESPLSTISVVQVAQFILYLTNPNIASKNKEKTESQNPGKSADLIHERLAEAVLNEILDACAESEIEIGRIYEKILSNFRLKETEENQEHIEILKKLTSVAINSSTDKRLKGALNRFLSRTTSTTVVE